MFAIIISEKGGPERREAYDKSEINVGRVQGNDLMLPKGNVSKHHARLLFRDGRFIVTDLKSTNGTYVNGKKIAQATVVREGDKIFIGDFVIRLEGSQEAGGSPPPEPGAHDESTLAREHQPAPPPPLAAPMAPMAPIVSPAPPQAQPMPRPIATGPAVTLKASTHPPGARPVPGRSEASVVQPAEEADDSEIHKPRMVQPGASAPPRQQTMPLNQVAPLAAQMLRSPSAGAPPPLPSEVQAPNMPTGVPPREAPPAMAPQPTARRNSVPPARPESMPVPARAAQPPVVREPPAPLQVASRETIAREVAPAVREASIPPPNRKPAPAPVQSGKTDALASLASRVAQAVDLAPLRSPGKVPDALVKRFESVARDQAKAMQSEGALSGVDSEALSRDLMSELVGLGPVGAMLDDDDIVEIHVQRYDRVVVARGTSSGPADVGFSSDEGVERVLERLCELSGEPRRPDELVVERRLANGAMVFGVLPPIAKRPVLSVRKRRVLEVSFDQLTRQNTLSRPMSVFLEAVVTGRLNALVLGPSSADLVSFVAAFVHAAGAQERIAIVEDHEELTAAQASVSSFRRGSGADAVQAAARTRPDRLVVTRLGGSALGATFDAVGEGCEGVVAGFAASSLRSGLSRLATQLVLQRPGLGAEAARELVAESFDTVIEVGASPDGRRRVLRITEVTTDAKGFTTRDVFSFNETDSSFSPSGVVPRAASELGARGVKIDASLFKRAAK
jgi:pilus assembly protein CpaF